MAMINVMTKLVDKTCIKTACISNSALLNVGLDYVLLLAFYNKI